MSCSIVMPGNGMSSVCRTRPSVPVRRPDHVVVETTAKIMRMVKKMKYEINLHPERQWYEMTITIEGFVKSRRVYKFEPSPEGTTITAVDEYQPDSFVARMLNGMGILKKRMIRDTTMTMKAFISEAEERFGRGAADQLAG